MSASSSSSVSASSSHCATPQTPATPLTPPVFNPGQSPNYSFTRPRQPSVCMQSLLVYVDAVNARDYASMESVFDEALEHRILPKSMARPVLTKKLYIEYWKGVMALFAKFETKIHEVIEAGDKLTVHGSTRGKSWSGTPYTNEYVLLVHFAPPVNGHLPKIKFLKEFVDSSVSLQFFKEESERRKRVNGVGSPPRLTLNGLALPNGGRR